MDLIRPWRARPVEIKMPGKRLLHDLGAHFKLQLQNCGREACEAIHKRRQHISSVLTMNVMSESARSCRSKKRLIAARTVSNMNSNMGIRDAVSGLANCTFPSCVLRAGIIRLRGMEEDLCLSAVQLGEDGAEGRFQSPKPNGNNSNSRFNPTSFFCLLRHVCL